MEGEQSATRDEERSDRGSGSEGGRTAVLLGKVIENHTRFLMLRQFRNGWVLAGGLFAGTVSTIGMAPIVMTNTEGGDEGNEARQKKRKERREKSEAQLRAYSRGLVLDKLDRGDQTQVEDYRHVVAVVGITGKHLHN